MDLRLPEPAMSGFADVAGVRIAWDSFGTGESVVLVVPTWNFVDSRVSARLVPDLARSFRVVTYDPRGAGRSDRPATGYRYADHVADATAVLAAAGVDHAALIAASDGANTATLLAAGVPDRVDRVVLVAPGIQVQPDASPDDSIDPFWVERRSYEGWERWNAGYWRRDWSGFARWFLETAFNEPDSEDVIDAIFRIAIEADPEMLIRQRSERRRIGDAAAASAILGSISVPTLIVQGDRDLSVPLADAEAVADAIPGASLAVVVGGGHRPDIRSPELVNPVLIDFLRGGSPLDRPGLEVRRTAP